MSVNGENAPYCYYITTSARAQANLPILDSVVRTFFVTIDSYLTTPRPPQD